MTISDWAIVLATFIGPIAAVQIQKMIESARYRGQRQQNVFEVLMSTRATPLAPEHVQALNTIEIHFGKSRLAGPTKKEKDVLARWKEYADHLNHPNADQPDQIRAWMERQENLLIELLESLAKAMGYAFDRVQLRRGIYRPRAHSEADIRREVYERAVVSIVTGEQSLPMKVTGIATDAETVELQKRFLEGILGAIDNGAIKVKNE